MDRKLHSLLSEHKDAIVEQWLAAIFATYPAETSTFLYNEKDPFANPMGHNLATGVRDLVEQLVLDPDDVDRLRPPLDVILRLRNVQEFSASQALAFVFALKDVMRRVLPLDDAQQQAMLDFDRRVDGLALLAFDIFMSCKEKLYEIRVGEMKRRTAKLVERMNRIYGTEPE